MKNTELKVTKKGWNDFKKYVNSEFKRIYLSEEYQELNKQHIELLSPKVTRHKFLWWKWESKSYPYFPHIHPLLNAIDHTKGLLLSQVPDITIENYYEWQSKV